MVGNQASSLQIYDGKPDPPTTSNSVSRQNLNLIYFHRVVQGVSCLSGLYSGVAKQSIGTGALSGLLLRVPSTFVCLPGTGLMSNPGVASGRTRLFSIGKWRRMGSLLSGRYKILLLLARFLT
ncbi:MAG: hypothetical protein GY927_06680 [bacterium]|nr:hypothetical protein [bacterium]